MDGLTRRNVLKVACSATAAAQVSGAQRPPNIVMLIADDHRWDALGCMGNTAIHTPELDKLARQGVLFENHFTTTAICCASRASIMLGQYAGTHGIYDFKTSLTPAQIRGTYWMRMKEAGYHVGFIGKFGVGDTLPSSQFDYWKGFPGQGVYFPQGPAGAHLTDIMRDQVSEFLEKAPRGQPFCLSVSFKAPHVQDEAPRQYLPSASTAERYRGATIPPPRGAGPDDVRRFPEAVQHSENRRRWAVRFGTPELYQASMKGYYALITGIDDAIGSMRAKLSSLGLQDNTIIIYSADHGIFNGEHGFAGKWYAHEEAVRMPLIIYDPRKPARRGRRRAMTLNLDLQPTILELAGLDAPASTQGRSLALLLPEDQPHFRRLWFYEHRFPANGWIPSSEGIRTERWKYIHYTDTAAPFEELYDLQQDVKETKNLADSPVHGHQKKVLTNFADRWRASLAGHGGSWKEPIAESELHQAGLI